MKQDNMLNCQWEPIQQYKLSYKPRQTAVLVSLPRAQVASVDQL